MAMVVVKVSTILAAEQTVRPVGVRVTGQLVISVMVAVKAVREVQTLLVETEESQQVLIGKEKLLGLAGLVIPLTKKVKLLPAAMVAAAVVILIDNWKLLLLYEQELLETVSPEMVMVHMGVLMVKSEENVMAKAGFPPSGCPVRKVKVQVEGETMEVLERARDAFEELKVVAVAAIEVLRCMQSFADLFQMKARVVGVSEGGSKNPEQVSLILVGLEQSVLVLEVQVKVMQLVLTTGDPKLQVDVPDRQNRSRVQVSKLLKGEQQTSIVSEDWMVTAIELGNNNCGDPQFALTSIVVLLKVALV